MKNLEYNEKKKHGTSGFPIEYYHVSKGDLEYTMPLHWHSEFEIVRIRSGQFDLYINNVKYEMQTGDFAVIECGALHRGTPKNCVYECIVLDLNMLRRKNSDATDRYIMPILMHSCGINCLYHFDNNILTATVSTLFNTIKHKTDYYELEIFSLLYSLFANLYKQKAITENPRNFNNLRQTKMMTDLLDWIDIHYTEHIRLSDLAEISGLSEKYLCKFFRDYTSRTPIEYINQLRIDNACRDMLHSDYTVTEAAFNNGFNNLSYFSKVFKKYKFLSPHDYVNKNL